MKALSIPRLEIISARILATLMKTVSSALSSYCSIEERYLWLDSKTALFWINNRNEWKQFVQHRVNEILRLSSSEEWRHCPGKDNPADLGSRGVHANILKDSELWWIGPDWLCQDKSCWPSNIDLGRPSEVDVEGKKVVNSMLIREESARGIDQLIDINKYSLYDKLLCVTAYVCRFINNLKAKMNKQEQLTGSVIVPEILSAERLWIINAQVVLRKHLIYCWFSRLLNTNITSIFNFSSYSSISFYILRLHSTLYTPNLFTAKIITLKTLPITKHNNKRY